VVAQGKVRGKRSGLRGLKGSKYFLKSEAAAWRGKHSRPGYIYGIYKSSRYIILNGD
jgi:hypothetical protein